MPETWVPSLGWEDPLEEEVATHSSILAWRIPWTEKPGGLQLHGVWTNLTRLSYWTQPWSLRTWCLGHPPTKKVCRHCQPPLGANPPLSENHHLKGTGQRLIKPKDRRQCSVISYLCEKDWERTTRVMSEESSSVFKKPTLKCRLSVVETTVYFFFFFHLFLLAGG